MARIPRGQGLDEIAALQQLLTVDEIAAFHLLVTVDEIAAFHLLPTVDEIAALQQQIAPMPLLGRYPPYGFAPSACKEAAVRSGPQTRPFGEFHKFVAGAEAFRFEESDETR